ncbi:sensor histidine kinase [Undibacterium sp. Di27W]|uniref:sensor histidine kinase n=1 Tax=Undibacterium sp. Di27W TaxID=3413036 RepID=UPI003BF2F54F
MTQIRILQVGIDTEQDVVLVRQRARQISASLKFSAQDQVRIATAVSEVARCAISNSSGGRAVFSLSESGKTQQLNVALRMWEGKGKQVPVQGLSSDSFSQVKQFDQAIITAHRLMDECTVEKGTDHEVMVTLLKSMSTQQRVDMSGLNRISEHLANTPVQNTYSEMQLQNQELVATLAELRARQDDLLELTHELEDTNRGVVALYAEIEEKAERLRRADEMKSRFLSNTSHELRTPLSSIRALATLLLDRMDGELTEEQERQVMFIAKAATDLSELVNDLLDLAKIEAGKVEMQIAPIDVSHLFGGLKGVMRPLAQSPDVELIFVPPATPQILMSDEGKISQVLRNFISNALKFTEAGSITISLAEADEASVKFLVEDTGIGISQDNLPLIFEEFSQIEHQLQRRVKGTGLGLPLCLKLARLLGGEVDVKSEVGKGSAFYLSIPREFQGSFTQTNA